MQKILNIPERQVRAVLIGAANTVIPLGVGAVRPCDLKTSGALHGRKLTVVIVTVGALLADIVRQTIRIHVDSTFRI